MMPRGSKTQPGLDRRRPDEGGAAMLVTLLVLTSATALGIFAAYSTASEVRGVLRRRSM